MNKTETVRQLPSATPAALDKIIQLERTLDKLERSLVLAINRIDDQQDMMADTLTPLLSLRDQVTKALSDSVSVSQSLLASARAVDSTLDESSKELREAARLLLDDYANSKPNSWVTGARYAAVSVLSVVLTLGLLRPSVLATIENAQPQVVLDSDRLAVSITSLLLKSRRNVQ